MVISTHSSGFGSGFGSAEMRTGASLRAAAVLFALMLARPILLAAQSPASPPSAAQTLSVAGAANVASASPLSAEELGDLQMARKGYQAAIQLFLQVSPKTALVWNKIGIAYQQMLMTEQAKKSYEAALKLNPRDTNILNNLATVYYSLKEYGRAERIYRQALRIEPKSPLVYKNLGTDLMAENKFKKGWECYQAALSIDPETFERSNQLRIGEPTSTQKRGAMNYYMAVSYARAGRADRAVGYLRMAIDEGFTDRKRVMVDKEFASLHGFSGFEQLIAEQRMQ